MHEDLCFFHFRSPPHNSITFGHFVGRQYETKYVTTDESPQENLNYFTWLSCLAAKTRSISNDAFGPDEKLTKCPWAKTGYQKKPIGKRKNRPKPSKTCGCQGGIFLTHVFLKRKRRDDKLTPLGCEGRGWCRAEMWCKLLSEKSDFPIIVARSREWIKNNIAFFFSKLKSSGNGRDTKNLL